MKKTGENVPKQVSYTCSYVPVEIIMAAGKSTKKPTTPPRGFTDKFLENLKPRPARFELADKACPGLQLRVYPSGLRTWVWY